MEAPAVAPELVVMVVHGTFPRGGLQQLRRNLRRALRRDQLPPDEAALWLAPHQAPLQRWWFEAGSAFEANLIERCRLPEGALAFERVLWSGRNTFADREEGCAALVLALDESMARRPGVPHVVLAHSHGGTVAVLALDRRARAGQPAVQALLTLGTPFVRLVRRAEPEADPTPPSPAARSANVAGAVEPRGGAAVLAATLLPGMVLTLAPLMALDAGLRADGLAGQLTAGLLGTLALWAVLRAGMISATMILAVLLAFGGAALRSDAAAFLLPGLFGAVLLGRRLVEPGLRYIEDGPLILPCPLLALRTPRDEASLAIGFGQVAQGLGQAVARLVDLIGSVLARWLRIADVVGADVDGTPRWRRLLNRIIGWLLLLVLAGLMAVVGAWLGFWQPAGLAGGPAGWLLITLGGVFSGLLLWMLVTLEVLLGLALPSLGISLAAGREAFLLPMATQVEAEPLPHAVGANGQQPAVMALEILYEARLRGLNHSLYEADLVRQRIALWLREQAAVAARPAA